MRTGAFESLTVRVILFSSLWAVLALVVAGGLISTLYARTADRGFEDLISAQLYNLVNSVSVSDKGELQGAPDLGDLRYSRPLSGWYWEVLPASDNTSGRLASASLGTLDVKAASNADVPFDLYYRRQYEAAGLNGEDLFVLETEVVLDADNHAARFRVMGNASVIAGDKAQFDRSLALYLGLVGLGSVVTNALAILFGLKPLTAARRALGNVRNGRAERLEGSFPTEIRPLAAEMNALIDNNRRIVERARTQVGNLAHSLKTPIAVLVNEAGAIGGEHGRLVADQSERMRQQVQHYLDRARVAAQSEGVVFHTPVKAAAERVTRVVAKLNPALDVTATFPATEIVFAGERQDLEEIVGNLMENAGKWARSTVRLTCAAETADRFSLAVEDDGPGLSVEESAAALRRGQRLDEAKPGSGLGLSIVSDIVGEYHGTLSLSRSPDGGLRAQVTLPRTPGPQGA
ncbi:ATP-binding protein [Aurantimonas sp. Leaf443]|uniref:ATP-binding protein n=1 Tax=Aurantimonas sp. Leaf443 TaxID=1736378 RepID=UPI0006F6CDB9|nr:ATP-binding protein [Aurantimonas sp. Leaf443]KQT88245.1 histidine kinase [Aurantimonas sp. Leaf443]